jgi:hypothetical protein
MFAMDMRQDHLLVHQLHQYSTVGTFNDGERKTLFVVLKVNISKPVQAIIYQTVIQWEREHDQSWGIYFFPINLLISVTVFVMFDAIFDFAASPSALSFPPRPTMHLLQIWWIAEFCKIHNPTYGVRLELASLSITSIPPFLATARTQFWFPKSSPHGNPISQSDRFEQKVSIKM